MQPLIIKVEEIEDAREERSWELDTDEVVELFTDAPAYKVTGGAELQAYITRIGGNDVLVEAESTVHVQSACRRCLRTVDSDLPVSFMLNFRHIPKPQGRGKDKDKNGKRRKEREDTDSDDSSDDTGLDEETFDGERIDLADVVREQMLLALPTTEPTCVEDCKGLCSTCGENLNDRDCGHSQKQADPRLAVLSKFKV